MPYEGDLYETLSVYDDDDEDDVAMVDASGQDNEGSESSSGLGLIKSDLVDSRGAGLVEIPSRMKRVSNGMTIASPSGSRLEVVIHSSPVRASDLPRTPMVNTVNRMAQSEAAVRVRPSVPRGAGPTPNYALKPTVSNKGRPKGWRPGMSYAEMRGAPRPANYTPKPRAERSAASGTEGKRRGRQPKAPDGSVRQLYLMQNPKFQVFGCEWKDEDGCACPAELQNMNTLRRHVNIVHADADVVVCRWGKCSNLEPPLEFTDEDAFKDHMEQRHLIPYSWHMGDGGQNKGILEVKQDPDTLPAYLFDQEGNQLLPSVKEQQPDDVASSLARKRKVRELKQMVNENAPEEDEYLNALLNGDDIGNSLLGSTVTA